MKNTITCTTMDQFLTCVAGMVRRGLTFEADADKRTITLTGGF
jgi:hypothetical protein